MKLLKLRIREQYQLEDQNGTAIQLQDCKDALLTAVQAALPNNEISIFEDYFWIDRLYGNGWYLLADAIATIPELANSKLALLQIVYCEADGTPIRSKERFYQLAVESNLMSEEEYLATYGADENEDEEED